MKISDAVFMFECTKYSRIYLICNEPTTLIDTGFPGNTDKIIREIESLGLS